MEISKYYTLQDFTRSYEATRRNLDNTPGQQEIENIKKLCQAVLDPLTDLLNQKLTINSGYRSLLVNSAVGSKPTSQHVKGQAADIEINGMSNYDLAKFIEENFPFDQLILEFYESGKGKNSGWVHVSYTDNPRSQTLTINSKGNQVGLIK
jgi:zinc D-Ala-D-Ala carboxypeptidase